MTTRTEQAIQAFVSALDAVIGPAGFPTVNRNEALDDLLSGFTPSGGGYINVVDGNGIVIEETLGAATIPLITGYEIEHTAEVEIFVVKADQASRDATFDAMLEFIATAVETDRTLGGAVDFVRLEVPSRSDYKVDGLPVVKSAVVPVKLTFTSSRPF